MEIFAKRLRELRNERELSIYDMGKVLGIAHNSYLRYEQDTSEPTQKNLVKLAQFFGVTTDYLLGLADI